MALGLYLHVMENVNIGEFRYLLETLPFSKCRKCHCFSTACNSGMQMRTT